MFIEVDAEYVHRRGIPETLFLGTVSGEPTKVIIDNDLIVEISQLEEAIKVLKDSQNGN
jgi:hypothetical protein